MIIRYITKDSNLRPPKKLFLNKNISPANVDNILFDCSQAYPDIEAESVQAITNI